MMETSITQKGRLEIALKNIKVDVTAKDRKACVNVLKVSKMTVSRYLNGMVDDNDTAARILDFLYKRIEKREAIIPAVATA